MRTYLVLALTGFTLVQAGDACSTFSYLSNGGTIVGKSYDWHVGHGMAIVNKRNVQKKAVIATTSDEGAIVEWVSKYGSLTFNQHGREFPISGVNEEGLVIEVLWGTAEHPKGPDVRPAINEVQWVQYNLDSHATVAEVIAQADKIRIIPAYADIHYFVCDATGACATLEYIGGELVAHTGEALPAKAFTNSTYDESIEFALQHEGFGGAEAVPQDTGSLSRFVRVALRSKLYRDDKDPIDYAFKSLEGVVQSAGSPLFSSKWNLVYEVKEKRAYFRTQKRKLVKFIDMHDFDFSCSEPVKVLDMNWTLKKGNVTEKFKNYSKALNRRMIAKNFFIPKELRDLAVRYPDSTQCLD